ncbi:unnamed protein product, partial [Ectocarpus fasciculatus]
PGSGGAGEEEEDDRTCLVAAKGCPRRAKGGDVLTLIDSVFGRRSRSSKLPGMRVVVATGTVIRILLCDRLVALPVTATVQTRGSRLFARASVKPSRADREQEGSSLFFVQLPTNFRGRWPRARGGRTAFPRSCGARGKRQ